MDLALEEIDSLLTDYMHGDDSALDGLLAAGPVSLRRLLAIRAGRSEPGWDMAEIMRHDRDDYRRPGEAQIHLARAFPDTFFDEAGDPMHEWAILETLEYIKDPRALPFLERHLRTRSPEYRRRALRGLAENGTADHTEAVAACLADPEARSEAVNTLARLGDARAVGPLLREHLADDSSFARRAGVALDQVEQRIGGPLAPPVWRELGPVVFTAQAVMGVPWCVTEVLVEPGQTVRGGEVMAILENDAICRELIADWPGTVTEVRLAVNDEVLEEAVVLVVQSRRRIG
ncbi:HEAT repeat domain-containing protein [Streptomyces sp. NBC_01351]|uniref:HEAT repeat domain-containing protein n=1 Tax=Streptomyces sp. NBC_01351 TaxID=2903833 RepID=UPI002E3677D6|nr:HEAT repeat domain-containing protein [Streptomyces sp. NBC_01351]